MHRQKIKMVENATPQEEEEISIEETSSPRSAQLLEYCYNSELLRQETMPSSQVSSCQSSSSSSYCYGKNSNLIIDPELSCNDADILVNYNSNRDACYAFVDDIAASIDFFISSPLYVIPPPLTSTQLDQLDDFSPPQQHELLPVNGNVDDWLSPMSTWLPSIAEDCVFSPSCATLLATTDGNVTAFWADILMTGELMQQQQQQPQELDYLGESGCFYNSDPKPLMFNPGDIQVLGKESQELLDGHGTAARAPLPPAETSAFAFFDDPTFKVGKLSTEEKKEKIHRYLKKRDQRNFSKKIKYACRKTLADSRPRVKGRFAKNDDCGKTRPRRPNSRSPDEEEECEMGMKEEDKFDQFLLRHLGHISAVNSFECSCLIQHWI